jgi:hypothetical protein
MTDFDDDGPEEYQHLAYCWHCGCRLNDPNNQSTREVEPQTCESCKALSR